MKFLIPFLLLFASHPNIDMRLIKYGAISNFNTERGDKVAVIDSKSIYAKLPSVILIRREGAERGSSRYYELMQKATKNYKRVLKNIATKNSFVLVVERGGVVGYEYEEITLECIKAI